MRDLSGGVPPIRGSAGTHGDQIWDGGEPKEIRDLYERLRKERTHPPRPRVWRRLLRRLRRR